MEYCAMWDVILPFVTSYFAGNRGPKLVFGSGIRVAERFACVWLCG